MRGSLDLASVHLLNDLVAMAYAIPHLGAEAGNLALRVLATGGVYLGGGLPRRLLPVLTRTSFLGRFREKGRLDPLLARIPLHVVIRPNVGLFGALQYALAGHAG